MAYTETWSGKINRKLIKKLHIIDVAAGREKADLVLYRNGEEFLRTSILDAQEDIQWVDTPFIQTAPVAPANGMYAEKGFFLNREHVRLDCKLDDVMSGEVIEARVWLSLSNGLTYEETVGTWTLPEYFRGE